MLKLIFFEDFLLCLKDHLLARLLNQSFDSNETAFSDEEWSGIVIVNNWLYKYKVMQVNYTFYDMQCFQDSLNLCTHTDVMMLSYKDEVDETK